MRTTKRFTPDVLDRFREEGRGQGTYQRYVPWHRVSRSDPASIGRSHLMPCSGRHLHLLSDDEWVLCLFTPMTPGVDDMREQFPLRLESGAHELGAYDVRLNKPGLPGTLEIAQHFGYRHPRVNGHGRSAAWVLTTDLLFTLVDDTGQRKLLAISCKPSAELGDRQRQLQTIERAYWAARDVEWLLITPAQYDKAVEFTLRNSFSWALYSHPIAGDTLRLACDMVHELRGLPLIDVLTRLSDAFGQDLCFAQQVFWQSVWSNRLPLDLRRGWRPHLPAELLCPSEFLALNPIASRRTAWI